MPLKPRAIHQFHAGSAFGDGVTQSMLFTRQLLRELGFASEIFCAYVAPELADELRPMEQYPDRADHVLFLHHSLGHNYADWVESLQSQLVLVYHNITPAEFFPEGHPMRSYCELGRRQLARWRNRFIGAIGDSPYNARELLETGYSSATTLPLLVDLNRIRNIMPDRSLLNRLDGAFNAVFVGRIAENKCQHDVIAMFAHLRRRLESPARLLLVGDVSSHDYVKRLHELCAELQLGGSVEMTGKVSNESLCAIYRRASVFVSMSEHEGFGMPLIEAMAHDVPVLAYNSSNIADTLGEGGLLLAEKDPQKTAALIKILSEEPELRRRILRAQRRNLERFERARLQGGLAEFLTGIGIDVPITPPPAPAHAIPEIRLEGPFDSSYSLALVNREFARALHRKGVTVALHATDGPGDYAPDPKFLAADAESREMWLRGKSTAMADVLLRDLYPPRVANMRAPGNALSNYAWEESGFPKAYADDINRMLTHVTVLSHYVRKVLLDNGVRVPVTVSGAGIDHLLDMPAEACHEDLGPEGFRFLHVSSCFPRKGVDVLLESFGQAFTRADAVSLVIKTFPNIHNDIESQLARFRERFSEAAPVILINRDISEKEVAGLYQRCDALVAPSRGEGFGLPIAEAMLFEKAVITTGHGGQMDFCTADNAWLVDYHFAYADTHMGQFNSVWAEPDKDDLVRQLRAVFSAPRDERRRRAAAGRQALLANWRWEHVAERNLQAIAALDRQPAVRDLPHVAWVTTWNTRCGIAAYAQALSVAVPVGQMIVLANHTNDLLAAEDDNVTRCWNSGGDDRLEELYEKIIASNAGAAVIQFNFGFFELAAFGRLIDRLTDNAVDVHVFFHATKPVVRQNRTLSLARIAAQLGKARNLFVHGVDDLNLMKSYGLVDNVTLFPHGVNLASPAPQAANGKGQDGKLIACFGYMLPNKGFPQLIEATGILGETHPGLRLLMLNASYPVGDSDRELQRCKAILASSPQRDAITLVSDFLNDAEVLARLRQADLIVFPYQQTAESSSAAIRFGLASGRPVACTPLPIFRDVLDVTFQLPGTTPEKLAEGIAALLGTPADLQAIAQRQATWLAEHDWQVVSTRLWNILRGCAVNRR